MSRQNLFSNNKPRYTRFLWAVPFILLFIGIGIYMNIPTEDNKDNGSQSLISNSNYSEVNSNTLKNDEKNSNTLIDINASSNNYVLDGNDTAYYLLKEVNGMIKLFLYDNNGEEFDLGETDIVYSLISKKDQEAFKDGIILKNQEEVNLMLQDFES